MLRQKGGKGHLLRWFHGHEHATWGTDPGRYDPEAVEKTVQRVGWLFGPGRYFRLQIEGWDNIPTAPVMVVSNHSGGTTIPDVWGFLIAWYRHFGTHRPIHPMAHEMILSTRPTGEYFEKRGVLQANKVVAQLVLASHRHDLMVMPGGDLDTWRPFKRRYEVRFGERMGYVRTALKAGVPIVPVANAGAHETLFVLTDGQDIARALGFKKAFRAQIFPIHFSLPWGLAVGPWPHIPTPARLRYRIGAPIVPSVPLAPGEEPSEEMVRELDARVRRAVQDLLDELKLG